MCASISRADVQMSKVFTLPECLRCKYRGTNNKNMTNESGYLLEAAEEEPPILYIYLPLSILSAEYNNKIICVHATYSFHIVPYLLHVHVDIPNSITVTVDMQYLQVMATTKILTLTSS